jgi:co-chaperonin GroES (HSP10)
MGVIEIPAEADVPPELRTPVDAVDARATVEVAIPDVDPALLPDVALWRVMILPVVIPEATQSGILLSADTVKHRALLRTVGKVVGLGPLAFTGPRFTGMDEAPCRVGDWVAYHSYQGVEIKLSDRDGRPCSVRFVNDDEILGRVADPRALMVMV